MSARVAWTEMEDGVLWTQTGTDIVAKEIAVGSPGERAGILVGDVLMAIDGKALVSTGEIWAALHASTRGSVLSYSVLRLQGSPQLVNIAVDQTPSGARGLYFALAVVGIFSLLVGAAVRLRRPDHQATLHFFWLSIAFFGMLAFSFSGRLDSLDWVFYWGDITCAAAAAAAVRPLRAGVPGAPRQLGAERRRPTAAAAPVPAGAAARRRRESRRVLRGASQGAVLVAASPTLVERGELVYLAVSLVAGLAIMIRALRRVRSVTARRQLRWIVWGTALGAVPFVFGYVAAVRARLHAVERRSSSPRCSSGWCRWRSRRRSSATA